MRGGNIILMDNRSKLTVVVHNGLANRLLPLVSCLRLAKKTNRKLNVIWNGTPVRSCIRYDGPPCKYNELYAPHEDIQEEEHHLAYDREYNFEYWLNKDMVMDVSGSGNIYTNYGLYTIIGEDDDKTSICLRLCDQISKGGELKFDTICGELGQLLRDDLRPVKEIQAEIDRMKDKYFFAGKKMIGIHIRSTDGGFVNIKWGEMINKLIAESKKWCDQGSEYGIFLATDNAKYYVEFAARIQSDKLVFYNPPKELCGVRSTNVDKFNNDKYNVLCGLIEMTLLGECSEGVIGTAASTFSVCGMLMGYTEGNGKRYHLMESVDDIPAF